jgi:hypothetical protein
MNTVLSDEAIKKALFDAYEEAQDYDEKGEPFMEKNVARKQDVHTRIELAKAVREMINTNPMLKFRPEVIASNKALQAVLKVMEGK